MTAWFAEYAQLPGGLARNVRFEITDGRFTSVTPDAAAGDAKRLPGVVLPGFANCHSHAFHRGLRARTSDRSGSFWTWRTRMYDLAGRLDPDSYYALARGTYAELALAGCTSVGEFHYLHHAPGGRPYTDPNAMAHALCAAARDAGIRLTLLDACYLAGGLTAAGHGPLDEVQRRFADPDAGAWAERVVELSAGLAADASVRVGVAAHSVRAVPEAALATVAAVADGRPVHVHVSEQRAENDACRTFYGRTPSALLADAGVLGPASTAVHATHVDAADVALLARSGTTVCLCPTTERDLGDGLGAPGALADAGVPISVGTDQHAFGNPFAEARGVELHERLRTGCRGRFSPEALLQMLTHHASIGWPDAGRLAIGQRADLVAVRLDTPRTAGADPAQVVFAAGEADVDTVLVDGRPVVRGGAHVLGDVGSLLADAIAGVW